MRKIYLLFIILFTTTLLILFIFYNRYSTYYEDEKSNAYISKNIDILNENLSFEKRYALSLSLFISKNEVIKEALHVKNQSLALQEIELFLKDVKKSADINNIDIQIHTKELRAFARNWDKSNYLGTELGTFRQGLVRVKKTKESFVSIELGKRLNIKAISPILDKNGEFMGSIEVIMNFKNIQERLEKFDLKMLTLLDKKFIDTAVDIKNHQKIGKYYIVEDDYEKELYQKLKDNSHVFNEEKFYYTLGDKIVVLVPMKSVGIDNVGVIALEMRARVKQEYSYPQGYLELENSEYTFNNNKRDVSIK